MEHGRFFAACGTISVVAVCAAVALHRPGEVRVITVPVAPPPAHAMEPVCADPPASPTPPPAAPAPPPRPVVLLEDGFDGENGGTPVLMYDRFGAWTVEGGTVDLIGRGSDWDFIPGHGLYVDLDGDRPDGIHFESGALVSRRAFELSAGTYELSFRIAGSQRGDANTTVVSLGSLWNESFTLAPDAPFQTVTRRIRVRNAAEARLRFENRGADGFGLLLDDVRLARVR
jgi:hypothetical protein